MRAQRVFPFGPEAVFDERTLIRMTDDADAEQVADFALETRCRIAERRERRQPGIAGIKVRGRVEQLVGAAIREQVVDRERGRRRLTTIVGEHQNQFRLELLPGEIGQALDCGSRDATMHLVGSRRRNLAHLNWRRVQCRQHRRRVAHGRRPAH